MKKILPFVLWTALLCPPAQAALQTIVPGGDWYDTSGNLIYATEGGILQYNGLYYLWGMDRSQNNSTFIGVNLYSSPDLKNWTFVNQILSASSNSLLGGGAVIERTKLLYNAASNQWVMWMHYEDHNAYNTAEVAYATCPTIGGNYTFQNHFRPMNLDSRDMGAFEDTDGTAYLLCSTNGNQNITIFKLDPTYTSVASQVFTGAASNGFNCEGHGMIKSGGTYFWITSSCSGWAFNDNHYYYATSLAGPWTSGGNIAPTGDETYESQVGWAFPVASSGVTSFVFMGDRWSVSNFSMSRMVMLPLQVSGTSVKLPWYDEWGIDAQAATWQAGPTITFPGKYKVVNRHSGKVLDVLNFSSAAGATVDQYTDNGGTNQQWTINNIGGSDYQFVNVNSGLVLDISGASSLVGAPAIQYTSNGGKNQKWHIIDSSRGAGYYRLINVGTLEKDLEIPGGSTANAVTAELGSFNYSDYQEWQFVRVDVSPTPTEASATPTSTVPLPTDSTTATPTSSPTLTVPATRTPTATRTATLTPTDSTTATPTSSPTLTVSPTNTAAATATASPTVTPSSTPTGTATSTAMPTETASSTVSRTPSSTPTPTFTATRSMTPTVSATQTWTSSATSTSSASSTPSSTATQTASKTATGTPTNTLVNTATSTATPSATATPTLTPTLTATPSPTASFTATASSTPSRTETATPTSSWTPVPTPSATAPPTLTPTFTSSPTLSSPVLIFPNPASGPGPATLQLTLVSAAPKVEVRVYTISFR